MDSPEEVVNVGDTIEVKVLRVDREGRKIGLSRKEAQGPRDEGTGDETSSSSAARGSSAGLKGGLGGGGPLFSLGGESEPEASEPDAEEG